MTDREFDLTEAVDAATACLDAYRARAGAEVDGDVLRAYRMLTEASRAAVVAVPTAPRRSHRETLGDPDE